MSNPALIRPLSDTVINQIAAGEVVERPASIVKELLENSLDAGATHITVELNGGGIERILVRDDGDGIAPDQLELALSRHCTSKLVDASELASIASLGFRGEALASIAAVAEVSITSRTSAERYGWCVQKRPAGGLTRPLPRAHPTGTAIEVRHLFASTPARRRFLKQPRTELLHIQQFLRRAGFCYPEVAFSLVHDDRQSLLLPTPHKAAPAQRRWRTLFGREFLECSKRVDVDVDGLRIDGWVGDLNYSRQNSDLQYIAVNRRIVRDRHIAHAVRMAYDSAIDDGRHAAYALRLQLPGSEVDVNVHPGKAEVRFSDPRTVHDVVYAAVKQALTANAKVLPAETIYPNEVIDRSTYKVAERTKAQSPRRSNYARGATVTTPVDDATYNILAITGNRFALSNGDDGLLVLDLHHIIARVVARRLARGECDPRPLIIPEALKIELADERIETLAEYGVDFGRLSAQTIALRAMPVVVNEVDARGFGEILVNKLASGVTEVDAIASAAGSAFRAPPSIGDCRRWFATLCQWLQEFDLIADGFGVHLGVTELARLFDSPSS